MSRTQSRNNSSSVSLFPFLAVLLCTMGGLVVLLVAVSHVSRELAKREKAKSEAVAEAAPDDQSAEVLAELERQAAEYAAQEAAAQEAVDQDQLRLAQVEQHLRKLQDEMALIQLAERDLESDSDQRYDDRAQAERELARLEQLIDDSEQEIAKLREESKGREKSYAVVPYKGANGTRRQPIYIECRADGVILQPEGIRLNPKDFAPPMGVGNPLAAALRAARDHMAQINPESALDPDAQPYPLILVRPDGIVAYDRVRTAIRSWDSDFGYEMIDADWNLAFSPPDPALASIEQRAIDNARIRREALASAAPSAFAEGNGVSFAVPEDDFVLNGGAPYDPEIMGGGVGGRGGGGQGYAGGPSGSGNGQRGAPNASTSTGQRGPGGGAPGSRGLAASGAPQGMQEGQPPSEMAPWTANNGGAPYPTAGSQGQGPQGQPPQGDFGEASENGQFPGGLAQAGPGGANAAGNPNTPGGASGGQSSASGSSATQSSAGFAGASGSQGGGPATAASLNERNSPDDVAIRRSVRVAVFADRLLVGHQAAPLPMPGPTSNHVQAFVTSVKQQIDSWGLAGAGLYWRPVIKLDVRQGGEQRAAEIERVLRGSGVDVEPVQTASLPNEEPLSGAR